jgi:hypothetical protein
MALLVGVVACDNDTANQQSEQSATQTESVEHTVDNDSSNEESLLTPADISEEAQAKMYQIIFDYNKCMMLGRLDANQNGQSVQQAANKIMDSCESHMEGLKNHLLANQVNESLVIGMTKKMRSRAARKLMTQGMNQMAAQAAAAANAEEAKAKQAMENATSE